jgi:hypothetical protein
VKFDGGFGFIEGGDFARNFDTNYPTNAKTNEPAERLIVSLA